MANTRLDRRKEARVHGVKVERRFESIFKSLSHKRLAVHQHLTSASSALSAFQNQIVRNAEVAGIAETAWLWHGNRWGFLCYRVFAVIMPPIGKPRIAARLSRTKFKHPIFTMLTVLLNVAHETETLAQQYLAKDGRVSTRTTPIRHFWPKLVVTGFRSFPRIPRMIGPPKDLMRPTDDYAAG